MQYAKNFPVTYLKGQVFQLFSWLSVIYGDHLVSTNKLVLLSQKIPMLNMLALDFLSNMKN